jgi:hypothetical protein
MSLLNFVDTTEKRGLGGERRPQRQGEDRFTLPITLVPERFWYELNYISFCQIFEKLFSTCAKIPQIVGPHEN